MTEKTYEDGVKEGFDFCIETISSILKSLETTGQNKTKVYVTLSNVKKGFGCEEQLWLQSLEDQNDFVTHLESQE